MMVHLVREVILDQEDKVCREKNSGGYVPLECLWEMGDGQPNVVFIGLVLRHGKTRNINIVCYMGGGCVACLAFRDRK